MDSNHKRLIEQTIKDNAKYLGNEDLLDEFCSDVYKKSYLLLDSVSNVENLQNYLVKVVDTSISNILKQTGRDAAPRVRKEISILESQQIKQKIIDEALIDEAKLNNALKRKNDMIEEIIPLRDKKSSVKSIAGDIYSDIEDPIENMQEPKITENIALKILSMVFELHSKYPEKNYFQIFYSRHIMFKKQAKVADELKISQSELSKRYFELVKLIKEKL